MLNTVTSATPAQPAGTTQAAAPVSAPAAAARADTGAAAPAAPLPFASFLAPQAGIAVSAPAIDAALQLPAATDGEAQPAAETADAGDAEAAPAQDGTLLAAMALPLMPLSPLQAAQVMQAMAPAGAQAPGGKEAGTGTVKNDDAVAGTVTVVAGIRQEAAAAARGAVQPAVPALADGTAAQGGQAGARDDRGAAPAVALPAVQAAQQSASPDAATATRLSVHAAADAQEGTAQAGQGNAAVNPAGIAAVPGAATTAPAADTVKLAGPPTAWRQSLQEALDERLNVQVTKNMEQAVIRLEPPQLGRIDIAIRHSAGSLEVSISASNGEVLRQLQTVSDNLRNDLAQRQFTDVAVTVAPAPRNAGTNPFGDPQQQQGRGRQQDRDQDSEPGRALAEAGNPASAFSLDGRG